MYRDIVITRDAATSVGVTCRHQRVIHLTLDHMRLTWVCTLVHIENILDEMDP
jgi:hypothetical protein